MTAGLWRFRDRLVLVVLIPDCEKNQTMTQREASDFPLYVLFFFFGARGLRFSGFWRHKPIEELLRKIEFPQSGKMA